MMLTGPAISTLLQPPIVRTGRQPLAAAPVSSTHKPPTTKDIPPVTLTNIPRVDVAEFRPYIAQVGALYEQLQRVRESGEDQVPTVLAPPSRRSSKLGEWADAQDEAHLRPSQRRVPRRRGSTASLASVASLESSVAGPTRRQSGALLRRANQGPPPLSTIPTVYFDEDFHLENPRTFDVVSERSEVVAQQQQQSPSDPKKMPPNGLPAAPRKALATNAILQEKLSWYMDTIEMHLIGSISTASTTFFSALGSLRELHTEAADSVDRIKALRKDLQALDDEIATTGLDIVQSQRRMANVQKLSDAVAQLRRIVDGVTQSEALVDSGDVDAALDRIEAMEALIAGEPEPGAAENGANPFLQPPLQGPCGGASTLIDLRGSHALQSIDGDIDTLRLRIGKAYEKRFVAALMADLRSHIDGVARNEVLLRWHGASQRAKGGALNRTSSSIFPTYAERTGDLRAEIKPMIIGLARSRHITAATTAFRDAVMREVRSIVKRPLPSSSGDDNATNDSDSISLASASTRSGGGGRSRQEKTSALARKLRALSPRDSEDMLCSIYVKFAEAIRRVTTQAKVLLDVASSLADGGPDGPGFKSPPIRSPLASPRPDTMMTSMMSMHQRRPSVSGFEIQEELHLAMELPRLTNQSVEVVQERIGWLLRVLSEQVTSLSLPWFLRYYTLNLLFVHECEAICGQGSTALTSLVTGHIKEFVQKHGDGENRELAQGMESDQWGPKDFGDVDAALLADVLACSTSDPPAWARSVNIWQPYEEGESGAAAAPLEANGGGGGGGAGTPSSGDKKEKVRTAQIDMETYIVPHSAILCLRGVTRFLRLTASIPLLAPEIATTLVAYLQLFNSRCTQLILGAGATRSAGLKNIAAKHLALASQAIGFVAALIPYVREFVRRHLGTGAASNSSSSVMGEFDKARHLMQEHQDGIYQKMIEIMRNRAAAATREMRRLNWDEPGSSPDSVHAYVEGLSRDTTILHRVLTKHLPDVAVKMIMYPVFDSYKEQFGRALREATPTTAVGKEG
jgi:vacuolar protein sorting-associated protein 54